jgi:hypothetical protein
MEDVLTACPMHRQPAQAAGLAREDELVLPMHKRVVTQYMSTPDGATELRLYYGAHEISFDEQDLFAFGEQLAKQERFIAGSAAGWGSGYDWPRIKALLETLLELGVLRRARDLAQDDLELAGGDCPSPLPAALATEPRSWHESEAVSLELTGQALEPGYLELVMPIFRIAHIALDADGRQVGEANVFPKTLRLDVPTRWRTCIYPGTRFHAAHPMNVTALKSMRAHWPQMMAMLARVRHAYLERFPQARAGWTVGHLERLATTVLALPTWLLMRADGRVANGQLHPALSSLFRVTDGLRMTMHQMLFVPIGEPALPPETPMTSSEIFAYAERNYSFYSDHGVCAGPQAMVEDFLAVLVDGKPAMQDVSFDPELGEALAAIDKAMDYGLLALQVHAAAFSIWPAMARAYERMAAVCEAWADGAGPGEPGEPGEPGVIALRDRLRAHLGHMQASTYLATEEWRAQRDRVYADMFAQCAAGLTRPHREDALPGQLAACRPPFDPAFGQRLRARLAAALGTSDAGAPHLHELAACLEQYFQTEQAIVRVACKVQQRVNALLGRPAPRRPFPAAHMNIHNLLQAKDERRLPYLGAELEDALGIRVRVDQEAIEMLGPDKERPA